MNANISSKRIRLTLVVTAKVTADTFVIKFARFAAENGFAVTVIADSLERRSQPVKDGSLSLVPVSMVREPSIARDLRSLAALFYEVRQSRPDIIAYATPKASLLSSIVGFVLRVPKRVYQVWGLRLETTVGFKRKILALMESLTSLFSTKIVANSSSLASQYRSERLNHSRQVDVLGQGSSHGVDLEYFSPTAGIPQIDGISRDFLTDRRTQVTIGFVGRLHPDKGIDNLLNAVKRLKKTGISVNVLLIGEDEGADFHGELNLDIDLLKVGHTTDVRPYYAVMDVLVLPSLREGFPNVVLEAAAMAVPAIVSDGTGVRDSVIDGETGFIVPVGDTEALAQAIARFSKNRELSLSLGAAARKRVEKYFSQEEVWQRTLDYFQL